MRLFFLVILLIPAPHSFSQNTNATDYLSITGAVGSNQGSVSLDYFRIWKITKSKKIEIGLGARVTSYFGSSQYYSSAPASLAADKTDSDSVLLQSPRILATNVAIHLGYRISNKFGVGFNIDAVGFSLGSRQNGFYINGNQGQSTTAKPTSFNVLLIGNNDRGSLNSEFHARYFLKEKLAVKIAYQYLFTEYTTNTLVQQAPKPNDRFRNKASLFSLGITKLF
jgi:long-subunit fatty acid transport protein